MAGPFDFAFDFIVVDNADLGDHRLLPFLDALIAVVHYCFRAFTPADAIKLAA